MLSAYVTLHLDDTLITRRKDYFAWNFWLCLESMYTFVLCFWWTVIIFSCLFFYAINVAAQMANVKTCYGQNWCQ